MKLYGISNGINKVEKAFGLAAVLIGLYGLFILFAKHSTRVWFRTLGVYKIFQFDLAPSAFVWSSLFVIINMRLWSLIVFKFFENTNLCGNEAKRSNDQERGTFVKVANYFKKYYLVALKIIIILLLVTSLFAFGRDFTVSFLVGFTFIILLGILFLILFRSFVVNGRQ